LGFGHEPAGYAAWEAQAAEELMANPSLRGEGGTVR